ncbi:hypothetical protein [Streptomyces sp. NPDC007905]|uniref:hypothetical protein n=1 Tax=Streptomyces sp. NPDC007905 TaxID=3364788 RepID=UPI0036E6DAC6
MPRFTEFDFGVSWVMGFFHQDPPASQKGDCRGSGRHGVPPGITGAEWTRTVVDLCDARLSATTDVRPLAGVDAEDGMACLDTVVAEIEGARFLDAEVRAALTDCARRCTPDVAFRILLRASGCAPDASLSSDQYTRLEAIGSALQYGEFVVDFVSYLVEPD